MNQEIKPGILRFVSILSLMFEKGIKKKKKLLQEFEDC